MPIGRHTPPVSFINAAALPLTFWLLAIRAEHFELGEDLGVGARGNLAAALALTSSWIEMNLSEKMEKL